MSQRSLETIKKLIYNRRYEKLTKEDLKKFVEATPPYNKRLAARNAHIYKIDDRYFKLVWWYSPARPGQNAEFQYNINSLEEVELVPYLKLTWQSKKFAYVDKQTFLKRLKEFETDDLFDLIHSCNIELNLRAAKEMPD